MSKSFVKHYEREWKDRSPSNSEKTFSYPGCVNAPYWEPDNKRDYHVPMSPVPGIDALLRENAYHGEWIEPGVIATANEDFPVPVITEEVVETVEEVGISGTHTRKETVNIDIHKFEKSSGGIAFDAPEEV